MARCSGSEVAQRDAGKRSGTWGQLLRTPRPQARTTRSLVRHTRISDTVARLHATVIEPSGRFGLARWKRSMICGAVRVLSSRGASNAEGIFTAAVARSAIEKYSSALTPLQVPCVCHSWDMRRALG